jgi:hypothetical protein
MLDQLLPQLVWTFRVLLILVVVVSLSLTMKILYSAYLTLLQQREQGLARQVVGQSAPTRQLVRGNLTFESPDIEPALAKVNEQLDQVTSLTQDDIEWGYEQGATNIEDIMTLVAEHKTATTQGLR